jgi:hypothetical protein
MQQEMVAPKAMVKLLMGKVRGTLPERRRFRVEAAQIILVAGLKITRLRLPLTYWSGQMLQEKRRDLEKIQGLRHG